MASSSKFDLEDLKAAIGGIDNASAQVQKRIKIENLGQRITPHLAKDGVNFAQWSRALKDLVEDVFDKPSYFLDTCEDTNCSRNRVICTFIFKSVHEELIPYVEDHLHARKIFNTSHQRFQHTSWSQAMNVLSDILSLSDETIPLNEGFFTLQNYLRQLKSLIGGTWTDEALMALFFHHFNKKNYHVIANALDAKKAIYPSSPVTAQEIMQIAQRFQRNELSNTSSQVIAMAQSQSRQASFKQKSAHPHNAANQSVFILPNENTRPSRYPHPSTCPASWALKWLNEEHPCNHWASDCPRKAAGKSPLQDPQIANLGLKLKKSKYVSHVALMAMEARDEDSSNVTSIQAMPGNHKLVLIDSGATHHVSGERAHFIDYCNVDLNLSVATTDKFKVKGIGRIRLYTPAGDLFLQNVLYCEHIPGVVISLGKFGANDGVFEYKNGLFHLYQNGSLFITRRVKDWWFLPLLSTPECNEVELEKKQKLLCLHHDRMAHVSMRVLRRMQKLDCVHGISKDIRFDDISQCYPCALAKSKHTPVKPQSRQVVERPGDVITMDLIGPLPTSIDQFQYAMIIQDCYSSLVAFIPLKLKSDAAKHVINWIKQFVNITGIGVKRVRTDNGREFNSTILQHFFSSMGIIHERTVPYEHHQNGKVERTNRTLTEATRLMVLHNDDEKMPYKLACGRKPSIELSQIFGCTAILHNMIQQKDLLPKGKKVIHLGVAQDSQGWVFYDVDSKRLIRGASALFLEDDFIFRPSGGNIKINNLFDDTMYCKILLQDEFFELMKISSNYCSGTPTNFREAQACNNSIEWMNACSEELRNLQDISTDSEGHILRYKARLVVQGHRQVKGINFEETFAPTPSSATLRALLEIASVKHWKVTTFDVTAAYLHSNITNTIFVKPPPGLLGQEGKVLKLKKALYGLKQAGRCWWLHLKSILTDIGFVANDNDQSTYILRRGEDTAMLWIHVDNGLLVTSGKIFLMFLKDRLTEKLKLKWDEKLTSIVGVEIARQGDEFVLKQSALIQKLVNSTEGIFTAHAPLPDVKLESSKAVEMDRNYLAAIGMILYLAQATRPDIMYSVNLLVHFTMNALPQHWEALRHLISYIATTKDQVLKIHSSEEKRSLDIYVDTNWGGEGSRSQHSYRIFLMGSLVVWNSKRQTCIASSTCQAEYMALSFAAKEGLWLAQNIDSTLGKLQPTFLSNNKSAIQIATNAASRKKSRHIQREFYIINKMVIKKEVAIEWIPTTT
ncbi:hypothetical protein O181_067513 [Austropuccinia psidii MF-1]|uniref:Integrase catalytic domain-containing protein n=1 Tax=Austropuccinia psidii MF-1 TaxID=1389203 RepID=A0A9Q3I4K9_9BASI|nr:hypothetical protein [Austropuccinia psidii MF-1]